MDEVTGIPSVAAALELLACLGEEAARVAERLASGADDGARGDETLGLALWGADAMLTAGDRPAAYALLGVAREATRRGAARAMRGDVAWRQGVVADALGRPSEAAGHFELAADAFGQEGAAGDEALARMRQAEAAFAAAGALDGLRAAREAVDAARRAGEVARVLEALTLTGELYAELGEYEEAMVRFREVLRRAAEAEEAGEPGIGGHALRAGIGVVEARLALGEDERAAGTRGQLAPEEGLAEGMALRARLAVVDAILAAGRGALARLRAGGELPPEVARAAALCRSADISVRIPRMMLQIGQRVERLAGHAEALPWLELARQEAAGLSDRLRLAPVHYALARCYGGLGRWVEADIAIEEALRRSSEAGDVEGLRVCTELGVLIAVTIEVPNLAVRRLVGLARARASGGDEAGRTRALIAAVEVALRYGIEDLRAMFEELMGALRETGAAHVAPSELAELARLMTKAGAADLAREAWELRAGLARLEGRRTEEARCLFEASQAAVVGGELEDAERLMERAGQLARLLGLKELRAWDGRTREEDEAAPRPFGQPSPRVFTG
jgi:tetratricopeptide (TPR) repeat protein